MRQPFANSTEAAVEAAQAVAEGPIEPPAHVHLRECDRPFWTSIVRARARATWTESDLEIAANLARAKADVERIQSEIDVEGDVIENQRGTPVLNPKHALLEVLSRRAVALSRMLHVHAEATNGNSRDQKGKLAAQKKAEQAAETARGDLDLIPGLRAVK
jgi:hypothetical protein